ncbi:MAG: DMT family transporter [Dehalococcoidia bacterium]
MSMGILLALLATLGWGASDVFARKAMRRISPRAVTVAMAGLIAVFLAFAIAVTDGLGVLLQLPWYAYVLTALMGFLAYVGGQYMYLLGMQRAGLAIAAPILSTVPLVSVFLAVALGGERPNAPTVAGAIIIVAGILLVITDRNRVLRE